MERSARTLARPAPVYAGYFADPFAWCHLGEYYAIGTGEQEASVHAEDKVFPLLHSSDFINWEFAGSALLRPDAALGTNFWAPEIAWHDGVFYLYYSVGFEDKNHHLRVAESRDPLGPYRDVGRPLLNLNECCFSIDPHAFRDDDGQWYLFYATDFLDTHANYRPGTALVVDKLKSMTELAREPKVVLRAQHDWQRFLKDRTMYGKVFDWHTLEGPCARKHKGRYYCFYSGGRWETESYGVDYAVADKIIGPYLSQGCESGPRVLRTQAEQLIGPGHNSIVFGPDGEDYIVYHAWDKNMKARQMYISRLFWTEEGPRV